MYLNPHKTYKNKDGKDFRVIAVNMIPESKKWIKGCYRYHWRIDVKFLESGEKKSLYYDYRDKLYKIKDYDRRETTK